MHRQPIAAPRVWLGTLIAGVALSLMFVGTSPAQAADGRATSPRPSVEAARGSHALAMASARAAHDGPAQIHIRLPGGPANSTVDWQWLYGRWQIRFNWAETRQMSRGLSYCQVIASLIPHWTAKVVAAACGILWVFADSAVNQRKCVEAYVSIAPTNPISFGRWNCPT
jgi:hypothetical protein